MLSDKICVAVANYDFSDNADFISEKFGQHFPTVLIDASSPVPPKTPHLSIANTYYPGLWNAAVAHALDNGFEWLMFVASDLQLGDIDALCRHAVEATGYDQIGLYTPSVTPDSRCAFKCMFNRTTAGMRECGVAEGFFFLIRTSILKALYPLGPDRVYGWNVDVTTCREVYRQERIVVADDRIMIHHPDRRPDHVIDDDAAVDEAIRHGALELKEWLVAMRERCLRPAPTINPTAALDLGCGPHPQNNFGANALFGIDIREIDNPNIKRADLNIEPIPFADNAFDYVTASDFVEHVARLLYAPTQRFPFVELMNEIHRVLKPGGVFLSITPAYPDVKAFQDPTHVNFITENTFADYFCVPNLWAAMYGYSGRFRLLHQAWDDGKLITFLRAI